MTMRLDRFLTERGDVGSRTQAQEAIRRGFVSVNGTVIGKPSFEVGESDDVLCRAESLCRYVSRGGLKLEAALAAFPVDPAGRICADIGASTGGFTDCLLQHGAARVYAIDAGHGQLHPSLRSDPRVVGREDCNARSLSRKEIPEPVSLAVMDVSFISQTKIYPALLSVMAEDAVLISLIKPQFEIGRAGIGKGGIVRDEAKRLEAVELVCRAASAVGLSRYGVTPSPIRGGDGNAEFLACFFRGKNPGGEE